MPEFDINTTCSSSRIIIENGCLKRLPDIMKKPDSNIRFAIITDDNVASIYRNPLSECLNKNGIEHFWTVVKPGDKSKSFENYNFIISELINESITRNDYIVAFGGGVVIDVAGFAASTYKRGMKWIIVPTSLLAQSDASIGGKTAIHFSGIKNLIGSFHQPSLVLIDPEINLTLPSRDYSNGLVEILKMSMLSEDSDFNSWQPEKLDAVNRRDLNILEDIIERACRMKASIVERDEFDTGSRIVLNLGHTLGHALESHGRFSNITHGEAVCVGILFISFISKKMSDLSPDDFETITRVFKNYTPKINLENIEWNELLNFIHHDKKKRDSNPLWVYPKGFGVVALKQFEPDSLENHWLDFRAWYSKWCSHEN